MSMISKPAHLGSRASANAPFTPTLPIKLSQSSVIRHIKRYNDSARTHRQSPLHRPRHITTDASSSDFSTNTPSTTTTTLQKVADIATLCFPLWALISGTVAFFHPTSLNWITTSQFEIGVGVLMLSMGLSLSTDDFRKCASNPIPILCGFICQYALLPILAFTLARLMNLPPAMATGLIILGSCPGGQASNVATFVAGGDVALSVLMTTVSTLAAAVMTPALATLLAGQFIPVDAWGLAVSTMQLVLFPTLLGVFLNETFPSAVDKVRPIMPLLALALTVVLMGVPVAQLAPLLKTNGVMALAPVMGLHFFGYLLGYLIPRSLKFNEKTSRTVSIETGMQSAAMGFALSSKHFSDIMVAVPSSVSIFIMVMMGSILASIWKLIPVKD